MSPILLNQLRGTISSPLILHFCKRYQENELVLKKSIDTSICTILIGLENAIENPILYENIMDSIATTEFYKTIEFENGKLSSINYCFEEEGYIPLRLIFPVKKARISEMISNETSVKSETARSILNFVVLLVLSQFKNKEDNNSQINSLLGSEKKMILNQIPESIRVVIGYPNFEYERTSFNSNAIEKTKPKASFLSKIFKLRRT